MLALTPEIAPLALLLTMLVASLLGSLHCVGMCGAFVAIAVGDVAQGPRRHLALQAAYHGGRLTTYLLLGLAAGLAGRLADLGSTLAGVRPVAATVAGAVLVGFGIVSLLRLAGVDLGRLSLRLVPQTWMAAAYRAAGNRPPLVRAALIGLLTTLLPCGWLYAFAAAAAGTGSPWLGMAVMGAFWLGTVPALAALGAGVRSALGLLGRGIPALTSVLLVVMGIYMLTGRSLIDPAALAARARPTGQAAPATECCAPR